MSFKTCTNKACPSDFVPSEHDFIVGRGRKIQQHSGNLKLRALVQNRLTEYSGSGDKAIKSIIISDIWQQMKAESCCGGFVKKDTDSDRWMIVSDAGVRATIAQIFRDFLSPSYKSSKFSKQHRRCAEKTKEFGCPPESTPLPLTDIRLQNSWAVTPEPLPMPSSSVASHATKAESRKIASDIIGRALQIMDANLVCLSDDPFEPVPILEEPTLHSLPPLEAQSFADFAW